MQRVTPISPVLPPSIAVTNQTRLTSRIYRALAATAWTAWKYADREDADDYIQTILIARSLTSCGGFDHADLVMRHRSPSGYWIDSKELHPGGVHPAYKGQVAKLRQSDDPLYQATDGVSDGAAMKIAAVAARYTGNFTDLIRNTDRIARITHASIEARLAAVLVALRLRQVFLNVTPNDMSQLVEEITVAAKSGKKTYDLFSKGKFAWVVDNEDETKLIATMKKASRLMIIGNTDKGDQTTDHYSMMGFTKAYNTAKKSCS